MGFFEGAQNFEINGGNFIDMRGTQIQYNSNMMSIRGNNNNAQMNPTYNSGGPSSAYYAPRYGPTQSHTSTYPGYMPSNPSPTDSSHTHSSHTNAPHNSTMYSDAEQQNMYYHYQASQFMQAQYQSGQQPHPGPPQPGQQPGQQPEQQQWYHHRPQPGQQSYYRPAQPGQQGYHQPEQPEQPEQHPHPSQRGYQPYPFAQQQQNTPTTHQDQQVFQNPTVESHQHRGATSSSTNSEDPDVTEITENLDRQNLS